MRKVCPQCEGYGTHINGVDQCPLCVGDGLVQPNVECSRRSWPHWELLAFWAFGLVGGALIVSL